MKKLYYAEGPRIMGCGIAGQFRIGVPREVSDDLAVVLLRKGRLKEFIAAPEDQGASAPANAASATGRKKGKEE